MILTHQSTFALITNTIIRCDKKSEERNMPSQYPTNQLRINDVALLLLAVDFYWNDK